MGRPPDLLKGIYAMGFQKPSRIREHAFPLLLRDGPDGRFVRSDRQSLLPCASLNRQGTSLWVCGPGRAT